MLSESASRFGGIVLIYDISRGNSKLEGIHAEVSYGETSDASC